MDDDVAQYGAREMVSGLHLYRYIGYESRGSPHLISLISAKQWLEAVTKGPRRAQTTHISIYILKDEHQWSDYYSYVYERNWPFPSGAGYKIVRLVPTFSVADV